MRDHMAILQLQNGELQVPDLMSTLSAATLSASQAGDYTLLCSYICSIVYCENIMTLLSLIWSYTVQRRGLNILHPNMINAQSSAVFYISHLERTSFALIASDRQDACSNTCKGAVVEESDVRDEQESRKVKATVASRGLPSPNNGTGWCVSSRIPSRHVNVWRCT